MDILNAESFYPEGPFWRDGALYYTEYSEDRIMRWRNGSNELFWHEPGVGPCAVAAAPGGDFWVCCFRARAMIRVSGRGTTEQRVTADRDGIGFNGPNDIASDGRGGYYFTASGRFDLAAAAEGQIFHMTAQGRARRVASEIRFPNGLALDPTQPRLLVNAHLARAILSFPVLADGNLGEASLFCRLADAIADPPVIDPLCGGDGMEIDAQGRIHLAQYGAGRLLILDPAGRCLAAIAMPELFPTNLAFGRSEDELFVTSIIDGNNAPYPGRLYRLTRPKLG